MPAEAIASTPRFIAATVAAGLLAADLARCSRS
jgi:hypothetical protein